MACGKIRAKLVGFFVCLFLIGCRSAFVFPGTPDEDHGGSESLSERPVLLQEGYDESLAGFQDLGDYDDVAELPREMFNGELFSSSEAAWDAMSPELKCGEDLMKLTLNGPEVAQIVLCRDNGAPVPLTELPPHCGYSSPTFGGLVYATPYDGCGVIQQGRRYVIQIQWRGNFAVISCPMMSARANEPFPETNPLEESTSTSFVLKPRAPGYPETFLQSFWPYNYPPYNYPGKVYPTVKPADFPTKKPQQPSPSPVFWPYNYPPYNYPSKVFPTVKPADVPVPTQKPQQPSLFPVFWPYNYPPYNYPSKVYPTVKPADVPSQKPQQPIQSPVFWPYNYPGKAYPTVKPADVPTQKPQQPIKSPVFWLYNYPGKFYPRAKPAIAQVRSQKPQLPGYSPVPWPVYYTHSSHPGQLKEPAPISQSPARTQKLQPRMYPGELFPQYNYYPNYLQPQYPQYPIQPTTPPITTTPQPCTASLKCKLPANQPPNELSQNYMPPGFIPLEGKTPSPLDLWP